MFVAYAQLTSLGGALPVPPWKTLHSVKGLVDVSLVECRRLVSPPRSPQSLVDRARREIPADFDRIVLTAQAVGSCGPVEQWHDPQENVTHTIPTLR